jgi:hypothetical protein
MCRQQRHMLGSCALQTTVYIQVVTELKDIGYRSLKV